MNWLADGVEDVNWEDGLLNVLVVTNGVLDFSCDWVNNLDEGVILNWGLSLEVNQNFQDFWLVDEGLDDLLNALGVLNMVNVQWEDSLAEDVLGVNIQVNFTVDIDTGGWDGVVDDWENVLVEQVLALEEGGEDWVSPELLEVWGGQVNLECGVGEVLTEEGDCVIGLEEWVTDEFVKAQNVDSIDGVVGVVGHWDGGIEGDILADPEDILPHTGGTGQTMLPLQQLPKTGLVIPGLGSNAGCEQCNGDESLHD